MSKHRRAILAACIGGLWFFSASSALPASSEESASALHDWVREITQSDDFARIEEPMRGATLIAETPFYMAPEQAAGHVTDGRTDL